MNGHFEWVRRRQRQTMGMANANGNNNELQSKAGKQLWQSSAAEWIHCVRLQLIWRDQLREQYVLNWPLSMMTGRMRRLTVFGCGPIDVHFLVEYPFYVILIAVSRKEYLSLREIMYISLRNSLLCDSYDYEEWQWIANVDFVMAEFPALWFCSINME